MGLLVGKMVTYFGNHYLDLCFLLHMPILLLCFLPPVQPDIHQMSHLNASETLADRSGYVAEEGVCKTVVAVMRGEVLEKVIKWM